jgi:hypothetical protein
MNIIKLKIPKFKVGDEYIHFTKYGGVNKGIVRRIIPTTVFNLQHGCKYEKYDIVNDLGIMINIDGTDGLVYKILK